jgi:uncharacterized protein YvpB
MSSRDKIWQTILTFLLLLSNIGVLASLALVYIWYRPVAIAWVASVKGAMNTYRDMDLPFLPTKVTFHFPTATRTPRFPRTPTPTQTATFTPSETPTPIPTATLTSTETPTETFTPLPTDTVTPPPTDTPLPPEPTQEVYIPPDHAQVEGVDGHSQTSTLDCESRSATDLAAYFSVHFDEMEFQSRLPQSDDPSEGFVGNYWDPIGQLPPSSYGVYAGPVARLLNEYGLNAYEVHGASWDAIRTEIASGRPVMVWVVNNTLTGSPIAYTASNGNTTTVSHFEHTVIVTGYDVNLDRVVIVDGGLIYYRTISLFNSSWSVLGNMAVLVANPPRLNQ